MEKILKLLTTLKWIQMIKIYDTTYTYNNTATVVATTRAINILIKWSITHGDLIDYQCGVYILMWDIQ